MNRLNTVIPSTLKTKAFEETESVSKNIARRLYQAVSNSTSNNASNGGTLNPGEPRSIPQVSFDCSWTMNESGY